MLFCEATLDDLLRKALGQILQDGAPVTATRGPNRELACVLLKLTRPRARLSHTETKGKPFSALGELAWYLAASNAADFITYYLSIYKEETEIDGTIHGAYGPRLFSERWNNQFENVVALLRRKPTSRKAVIQLFDADDLAGTYKDVPCTCTLQFMNRGGKLDLVTSMRSNDAYRGLPHDVFCFTMLQEIAARMLGIEPGEYHHFAASLHLYDRDDRLAREFIAEGVQGREGAEMPPMPPGDKPWPAIKTFLAAEAALRGGQPLPPDVTRLDPYWRDLVNLLRVFRHADHEEWESIRAIKDEMSHRFYKEYIDKKLQAAGQETGPHSPA
jgi:thymidylate synthase